MQEEEPEEKRSILHRKLVHITLYVTYAGRLKRLFLRCSNNCRLAASSSQFVLVATHADDSCGGKVFTGVCLSVCLSVCFSARFLKNRFSLGKSNLT